MFTLKHEIEGLILITIAGLIGLFVAISINNKKLEITPTVISIDANSIPSVYPTETPPAKEITVSQISSDASKRVILNTVQNSDGIKIVTLSTQDGSGENKQIIFSKTLEADRSIIIPYNTWSPDNKYFFIQENTPGGKEIRVFNAKGEPFASGETYLDLTGLFKEKNTGNNFLEATGWASETLIIVNATTPDNTKVSYWFEVPSKAIIQLSTVF